jgi:hypothetical protein
MRYGSVTLDTLVLTIIGTFTIVNSVSSYSRTGYALFLCLLNTGLLSPRLSQLLLSKAERVLSGFLSYITTFLIV